nr:unnamed protein product [Callosobruchus analis]
MTFLLQLFAIAGIGVSIWMLVDPTIPLHFTQEANDYLISTVIIFVASIILLFVAILGIYSVSRESRKALIASFCLLLIIVVAQIAAGVWGYINRESLDAHIRASVKKTVREDYDRDENVRRLFDTIQSKMECCGAERPTDWTRVKEFNMGVSSNPQLYNIPESCCRPGYAPEDCRRSTTNQKVGSEPDKKFVFERGCYTLIMETLSQSIGMILIVGGVILAIELIGLLLGLIISCSMNRTHRYKA